MSSDVSMLLDMQAEDRAVRMDGRECEKWLRLSSATMYTVIMLVSSYLSSYGEKHGIGSRCR